MKRFLASVGVLVFVAAVLVWLRPEGEKGAEERLKQTVEMDQGTISEDAGPAESNFSPALPKVQESVLKLPESVVEQLSPEAKYLMEQALGTFRAIEVEKRRFPKYSAGEVLLRGAQRKLFLDDYTYSMILSGADCSEADEVYMNLLRQASSLDGELLKEGGLGL